MQVRLSEIQPRLQAYAAHDYEGLKAAANLQTMRSVLWENGWVNLFLGALTAWLGSNNVTYGVALGYGQLLFGALLMVQSVRALLRPRVCDVLRFTILVGFAGAWNTLLALLNISHGSAILLMILGVIQLRGAFSFYKWHRQLSAMQSPPVEAVELIKTIWEALRNADVDDEPNVYEYVQSYRFRVWLPDDYVIIAPRRLRRIFIGRPQDFELTYKNRHAFNKHLANVYMKLDNAKAHIVIPRLALERYEQWKASAQPAS